MFRPILSGSASYWQYLARRVPLQIAQGACLYQGLSGLLAGSLDAAQIVFSGALVAGSVALGSINALIGHAVVHACSHLGSFTGSIERDRRIGSFAAFENLFSFDGYRVTHRFHHAYTNEERDPNRVLHGQSYLSYVSTLTLRSIYMGWRVGDRAAPARSGPLQLLFVWLRNHRVLLHLVLFSVTLPLAGYWLAGLRGLLGSLLGFFAPMLLGHLLAADFSWRTHVGLPARRDCKPYCGQDTRSFQSGIFVLLNFLTFDFYRHKEHHAHPRHTIWVEGESC